MLRDRFFVGLWCLLIGGLCTVQPLCAQSPVITNVNKAVETIDGKAFHIHTVLKGQTLYSISKAYGLKVPAVLAENPKAEKGLWPGQKLRIPAASVAATPPPVPVPEPVAAVPTEPEAEPEPEATKPEAAPPVAAKTPKADTVTTTTPSADTAGSSKLTVAPTLHQVFAKADTVVPVTPTAELEGIRKPAEDSATVEAPEPATATPDPPAAIRSDADLVATTSTVLEAGLPEGGFQITLEDTAAFAAFCRQHCLRFYRDTATTRLLVNENFFLLIDRNGRVQNVRDERTVTNQNTDHLQEMDREQLKNMPYAVSEWRHAQNQALAPLGVHILAERTQYTIKLRKKKIRVYNEPFFVEYLKPDHPHYALIRQAAKARGKERGRACVSILDAEFSLKEYQRVEYNPFAEEAGALHSGQLSRVMELHYGRAKSAR